MKNYLPKAILGIPGTSLEKIGFSATNLANFWLMQESRKFPGYQFSISSCFISSSSGPNLVLEQIISAL